VFHLDARSATAGHMRVASITKTRFFRHRLSRPIICASWSADGPSSAADGRRQHALFEQALEETPGFAFVVRSIGDRFPEAARMDDLLDIVTWPSRQGPSITLAQEVAACGEVLVKAQVRVASSAIGQSAANPKALRVLMKADLLLAIGR